MFSSVNINVSSCNNIRLNGELAAATVIHYRSPKIMNALHIFLTETESNKG